MLRHRGRLEREHAQHGDVYDDSRREQVRLNAVISSQLFDLGSHVGPRAKEFVVCAPDKIHNFNLISTKLG